MSKEKIMASPREAYGKTLAELGEKNKNIVVLDADLSSSTQTCVFGKKFPQRFFNLGVAEQDMMSTAAGLATTGKIVFTSTFAVFCTGRAWDQVKVSIAYPRLNVKIVATHGGITVGEDGVTHHALEDIALMRLLPNMTIVVPADSIEVKKTIEKIVEFHGPVYVRLTRCNIPNVYANEDYKFEIGKGLVLRAGTEVSIIACGILVAAALEAADILENEGISARVINMHTVKPLDRDLVLQAAHETGAIVTAEEHQISGGLGSAVGEIILENVLVPVIRLGVRNIFAESGKPHELLEKYGLTAEDIVKVAKQAIQRKK